MAKAFTALVASMIGGAFVLESLAPDSVSPTFEPAVLLQARSSAGNEAAAQVSPHSISSVTIIAVPSGYQRPSGFIDEASLPAAADVVVNERGLLEPTNQWQQDMTGRSGSDELVVWMAVDSLRSQPLRTQSEAVHQLIATAASQYHLLQSAIQFESHHPQITPRALRSSVLNIPHSS